MKVLFKMSDKKLDLSKAVELAVENEDAENIAKKTIKGSKASATPVLKMRQKKGSPGKNETA